MCTKCAQILCTECRTNSVLFLSENSIWQGCFAVTRVRMQFARHCGDMRVFLERQPPFYTGRRHNFKEGLNSCWLECGAAVPIPRLFWWRATAVRSGNLTAPWSTSSSIYSLPCKICSLSGKIVCCLYTYGQVTSVLAPSISRCIHCTTHT